MLDMVIPNQMSLNVSIQFYDMPSVIPGFGIFIEFPTPPRGIIQEAMGGKKWEINLGIFSDPCR